MFGDGWPEVERSVRERVRAWKRVDEDLIGPEAALRLLTVGGSTSYTRHWWGQGRWAAICRAIVSDAVDGGVALPSPYEERGPDDFIRDSADPDELDDAALAWMIDMPGAGESGLVGLRFHSATRPLVREFSLYLREDD